jgi:hypothetical protein
MALTGAVAQYGRGIVQDVSAQLIRQFAECLQAQLETSEPAGPATEAPPPQPAKPISGLSLGVRALGSAVRRLFGRLGRRG